MSLGREHDCPNCAHAHRLGFIEGQDTMLRLAMDPKATEALLVPRSESAELTALKAQVERMERALEASEWVTKATERLFRYFQALNMQKAEDEGGFKIGEVVYDNEMWLSYSAALANQRDKRAALKKGDAQ